jgi:hypothetical protein
MFTATILTPPPMTQRVSIHRSTRLFLSPSLGFSGDRVCAWLYAGQVVTRKKNGTAAGTASDVAMLRSNTTTATLSHSKTVNRESE